MSSDSKKPQKPNNDKVRNNNQIIHDRMPPGMAINRVEIPKPPAAKPKPPKK